MARFGSPRFDNHRFAKPERKQTTVAQGSHTLVTLVTYCHLLSRLVLSVLSHCIGMVLLNRRKSQRKHKKVAALVAGMVGGMVVMQACHDLCKTPMHTSIPTGEGWFQELLAGHPARFQRSMGMSKHVF